MTTPGFVPGEVVLLDGREVVFVYRFASLALIETDDGGRFAPLPALTPYAPDTPPAPSAARDPA